MAEAKPSNNNNTIWVVLRPFDEETDVPEVAFTELENAKGYVETLGYKYKYFDKYDGSYMYKGDEGYKIIYPVSLITRED